MNTLKLKNALSGVKRFSGVFSRDQFLNLGDIEGVCIVNTHFSTQPGEHWFVVEKQDDNIMIFDSYGSLSPVAISSDIMKKVYFNCKQFWMNTHRFQSLDSNVCGDYCIFYTIARAQGYSVYAILSTLKSFLSSHERDHARRQTVMRWCNIFPPLTGMGDDNVHVFF